MAAERGTARRVSPRSGHEHTKWKTTPLTAGRDGPARPIVRSWLQRFLVDLVFGS